MVRRAAGGVLAAPGRVWGSSLPLRVITSTLIASVFILLLAGYYFSDNTRRGIVDAKLQASAAEAGTALQRMQTQLDNTDLRTESLLERLGQLADEMGAQQSFRVIIETDATIYSSRNVRPDSVPADLREQMTYDPFGIFYTVTEMRYDDGGSEPGVVVGGHLVAPSGQLFPVYFLFPATHETQTLQILRGALWSTGGLLLVALSVVSFLVTRQVTVPLRAARDVAGRIAAGDLDQRLRVRGTDEIASLATSMNNMAAELQDQIGQLEDLSRVQQQFVSDVSHELRTPLTTMRMATEMLHENRAELNPVHQRSVELLHDQEERFESMLADLLEISRFDAGAAVLTIEEVDVLELVEAEVAAQEAVARSLATPIHVVGRGSTLVDGDARRITRVIRNLLSNALEHGEQRPITITVSGDDSALAVTVRDRGVGFEPEQADQVFLRFWRADASRNRIVGGTGLGLAIALEDARLHHGWLEAWGRPGQGAQFRLTLPRNPDQPLTHSPLPLQPTAATGDLPAGDPEEVG